MFWFVALVIVAGLLGVAAWYDRKKDLDGVNVPDRPLSGNIEATSPHQVDRLTRRRRNGRRG